MFNTWGSKEQRLAAAARHMLAAFTALLVALTADGLEGAAATAATTAAMDVSEGSPIVGGSKAALLRRFDAEWVAYLTSFAAWKGSDAAALEVCVLLHLPQAFLLRSCPASVRAICCSRQHLLMFRALFSTILPFCRKCWAQAWSPQPDSTHLIHLTACLSSAVGPDPSGRGAGDLDAAQGAATRRAGLARCRRQRRPAGTTFDDLPYPKSIVAQSSVLCWKLLQQGSPQCALTVPVRGSDTCSAPAGFQRREDWGSRTPATTAPALDLHAVLHLGGAALTSETVMLYCQFSLVAQALVQQVAGDCALLRSKVSKLRGPRGAARFDVAVAAARRQAAAEHDAAERTAAQAPGPQVGRKHPGRPRHVVVFGTRV